MSVPLLPWSVSNPRIRLCVITIVVVIVTVWSFAAKVVSTYSNVIALTAMLFAGSVQQRRPATAPAPEEPVDS